MNCTSALRQFITAAHFTLAAPALLSFAHAQTAIQAPNIEPQNADVLRFRLFWPNGESTLHVYPAHDDPQSHVETINILRGYFLQRRRFENQDAVNMVDLLTNISSQMRMDVPTLCQHSGMSEDDISLLGYNSMKFETLRNYNQFTRGLTTTHISSSFTSLDTGPDTISILNSIVRQVLRLHPHDPDLQNMRELTRQDLTDIRRNAASLLADASERLSRDPQTIQFAELQAASGILLKSLPQANSPVQGDAYNRHILEFFHAEMATRGLSRLQTEERIALIFTVLNARLAISRPLPDALVPLLRTATRQPSSP